jgi:hypothetical protein
MISILDVEMLARRIPESPQRRADLRRIRLPVTFSFLLILGCDSDAEEEEHAFLKRASVSAALMIRMASKAGHYS